jgi:DNA-binding HxlR family transcriptional regulator
METIEQPESGKQVRWNVFNDQCPTRMVLNRIADKWAVMIILQLAQKTCRFGELKREIAGISQKMLAQTLRALERDGMLRREVFAEVPPRVEYSLTPLGSTLIGILSEIKRWSESNIEAVLAAHKAFDEAATAPKDDTGQSAKVIRLSNRAR